MSHASLLHLMPAGVRMDVGSVLPSVTPNVHTAAGRLRRRIDGTSWHRLILDRRLWHRSILTRRLRRRQ